MDKQLAKKITIVTASILALGIVGLYTYEWVRLLGKKKVQDEGFDIYVDEQNQ
jgi:hypothetical protein